MKMKEMIEAVRAHAEANYERDGWDIVVECYDDAEIEELIVEGGMPRTAKGAIKKVEADVKDRYEIYCDIAATAF